MNLHWLDTAMWAGGVLGQAALLWVLIREASYKEFPLFTSFVGLSILSDAILALCKHTEGGYFVAYYALKVPEALLELGILMEIASNVVRPARKSLPSGMLWLLGALLLMGSAGGIAISLLAQPHTLSVFSNSFLAITFGIAVLRLLIFAAIAGFAQLLGLGWRSHVLQLATGLAFYGGISVAVELFFFQYGTSSHYFLLSQIRIASYLLTLGYWIFAFLRQEVPRQNFSPQMTKVLVSLAGSARDTREALRSTNNRQ